MDKAHIALTAIYLKIDGGYVGFVEELPGVHSQGHTLPETRQLLESIVSVVFQEERASAEEMLLGKQYIRESFFLPIPTPSPASADDEIAPA